MYFSPLFTTEQTLSGPKVCIEDDKGTLRDSWVCIEDTEGTLIDPEIGTDDTEKNLKDPEVIFNCEKQLSDQNKIVNTYFIIFTSKFDFNIISVLVSRTLSIN